MTIIDIFSLGLLKLVLVFVFSLLLTVLPFWFICKKAGFHPALSFLMIIPLANVVLLFLLAFTKWPALQNIAPVDTAEPTVCGARKKSKALIVIGAVLLTLAPFIIITGTAYTFTLPKIYVSRAIVQTVFPDAAYRNYNASTLKGLAQTYSKQITAAPVLYKVIDNLDLQTKWGREDAPIPREVARKILVSSTDVAMYRDNMDLVAISVHRQNAIEAAFIANELAKMYQAFAEQSSMLKDKCSIALVEKAEFASRPCSPNLILNVLLSVVLAGVFAITGGVLLLVGLKR